MKVYESNQGHNGGRRAGAVTTALCMLVISLEQINTSLGFD